MGSVQISSADLGEIFAGFAKTPGIQSLLLAQAGEILGEKYWNGGRADLLHDVRSVTKSVASALVGIAIREGYIASVHDPIRRYLASAFDLTEPLGRTTLADLLTMRAGQNWDVDLDFTPWVDAPHQVKYVLERPIVDPPGTLFNYSDGSAHLVSVILSEATGMTALSFADEHLFEPLGISNRQWWLADSHGYNLGGVGLQLRTRDMLALGTVYLNEGRLGDRSIIPADWVRGSTRAHVVGPAAGIEGWPTDTDAVAASYGHFWWIGHCGSHGFYFALGVGGQCILNVPDAELTLVSTLSHRVDKTQLWQNTGEVLKLIARLVLPAAGI